MTPMNPIPQDVSRRALSIARMIDRLPAGKYTIHLVKSESDSERWQVEIVQPVTIQKKDLAQPADLLTTN